MLAAMDNSARTLPFELHQANRQSWNTATRAHNSHKGDQAAFLAQGGSTLFPEELRLLGPVEGVDVLHLQCNCGQDSLSLARLGARVTGVDISDEAVEVAQQLSAASGIAADFVRSDVYDYLNQSPGQAFDLVFSSYGALCWLSDLDRWARGVAACLRPGGRLVLMEFHPFWMVFDEQWKPRYDYRQSTPYLWSQGVSDYVGRAGEGLVPWGFEKGVENFTNPHPCYEFLWGLGDIVTSVLQAGLNLQVFEEYPFSNGAQILPNMQPLEGRRFGPPEGFPSVPLMFGLRAGKA